MKLISPASGKRQGLDDNSQQIHSSTKPTKLNTSRSDNKVLAEIACKWVDRGFYSTSSRALDALIKGVL